MKHPGQPDARRRRRRGLRNHLDVESPTAFGWPGAGGQIGFAEPATGISFAFLQMGDTDQTTQFVRGVQMSNLALALGR